MKTYRILSLGAGVQSTALYLMAMKGEIEAIDCAIFADTQEEPLEVYRHLEWMKSLGGPRIYIGTAGKLGDDMIACSNENRPRTASIPFFTLHEGRRGLTRRQCTSDYKLDVIDRTFKREIVGLVHKQRMPKDIRLHSIIGISLDETARALRIRENHRNFSPFWKAEPEFPLIKKAMTRTDCHEWLKTFGVPHEVPRSACVFCPYHSNAEWRRIKSDAASWKRVLEVDSSLRNANKLIGQGVKSELFLHRSCKPIDQVDFGKDDDGREKDTQTHLGFWKECQGMCGL